MLILGSDATKGGPAPWVTWGLIVINMLAFSAQLATGDAITNGFSLVPREFTTGEDLVVPQKVWLHVWVRGAGRGGHFEEQEVRVPQRPGPYPIQLTLFTHMFLHGGWAHLFGNMWFLFIFGGQVERSLRPGQFLAGYVLCGLAAGLAQVAIGPHSVLPCLGASGAISGVMGAYLFVHPFSKIRVWMGVWAFRMPASLVLGLWFIAQVLSAAASVAGTHTGVASAAHAGGFVAGLAFICFLVLGKSFRTAAVSPTDRSALAVAPPSPQLDDCIPAAPGVRAVIGERRYHKVQMVTIALMLFIVCLAGGLLTARDFLSAAKSPQTVEPKSVEASATVAPLPEPEVARAHATIRIRVPADTDLWLDDVKSKQTGRWRWFQTPPLEVGKDFEFVLRARWFHDGQVADQTRRVTIQAGGKADIDFTRPETPHDDEEPPRDARR